MQQTEASKHVRMITQEIRKSLDRHNILYTTLLELSKTLGLKTCAVWMPNDEKPEMNLTHELNGRNVNCSIPITNPDVVRIKESDEVNIIDSDSVLVTASSGDSGSAGPVAAIRMPMLRVSNFSGGTPEIRETCYAILVLILPVTEHKSWSAQELEIIKGVADQVAVALSHAAILEESLLTRVKLEEQNRALQVEKMNTMRANQAREAFQKIMSNGMGKPMHSILGLLSVMKEDKLKSEQKLIVDSLLRTSSVLSNLLNDAMDSARDDGRFPLEMKPFGLHALVRETACLARFMCVYRCLGFVVDADKSLPDNVIGDEKRVSQVLMHMIGSAINGNQGGGTLVFRVYAEGGSLGRNDQGCSNWTPSSSSGDVNIRFEIGMKNGASELENSVPTGKPPGSVRARDRVEERLSFSICKRIIQSMQGNIWFVPNAEDHPRVIHLSLRFQLQRSMAVSISETGEIYEPSSSEPSFRGLQVLLVENDNVNRAVTQWLLQKLGCIVTSVSSGYECLSAIQLGGCSFQVIILELHMPELDGFEVASRIRKFGSQNWPVIIALTASTGDFSEKCKQVGMNGVIRKPVLLQGLASELRRIMSTVL
ncbi:unnamed protein product [Sphenostylis stenocarpa]|uniref:Response regulatory domain-containing protein n=1 Tax=Sphenostylis stenocarpa TaxID=92480 RepID=A0AA86SMU3_9FABA|nr:unnamed protein product [Sphenostylis stenocarpa]